MGKTNRISKNYSPNQYRDTRVGNYDAESECEHASDKAHIDVIVKLDGSTRLIPTVAHCMYASK